VPGEQHCARGVASTAQFASRVRARVQADFVSAKQKALYKKKGDVPDGLYV
jgi:hypothetical protein